MRSDAYVAAIAANIETAAMLVACGLGREAIRRRWLQFQRLVATVRV
jgi:hypothetical protein